jgi:glycosyltransferase involved in cell wall biosynthesis
LSTERQVPRGSTRSDLVVTLERPLPSTLPVGAGTAVFCLGTCFHRHERVVDLKIVVDGMRYRTAAFGMPRPDVARAMRDPGHSYRSGFWATVPIEARSGPTTIELEVAVRLEDQLELVAPLGQIEVVERDRPPCLEATPGRLDPGLIAICMATFEPEMHLFREQIDSLRSQIDDRWVCLISDDSSSPRHFEGIERVVGADRRFVISRSEKRHGFYRNFERALEMVPAEAEFVALCDQDDRWHPDKLQALREALGTAQLVYSDQRLVDIEGRVLRNTLWHGRRNNSSNLASMLVANTITGAAMLFRRELAEMALPFPDTPGFQFHDHWLAVVALATGKVAYVNRPLYDYVQHRGAVFGDVTQGSKAPKHRGGPQRASMRHLRAVFAGWRAAYFYGFLAREVQAQTVLVRCSTTLTPDKRRTLRRFVASASSPIAFAWLATRPLRALAGRTETLGSETQLACGILWRQLVALLARMPIGRMEDASFPAPGSFNQKRLRRWRARLKSHAGTEHCCSLTLEGADRRSGH